MIHDPTFMLIKLPYTEKVFTVKYPDDTSHIFERLFDNWSDVEYLFDFFYENITDLHSSYWQTKLGKRCSVEEAITITLEHALSFEAEILSLAYSNTSDEDTNALTAMFKPLTQTYYTQLRSAMKSYGTKRNSWLRMYAIQIQDVFIITGGAIKLTQTMQERQHTKQELDNLIKVANELKRNLFTENTDFDFVSFEI